MKTEKYKEKKKENLDEIGKSKYNFDFSEEKKIYYFVSHYKINGKKNITEELKFDSYNGWKRYVINKYSGYSKECLTDFSRYLNLRIRQQDSYDSNINMLIPVTASVVLTRIVDDYIKITSLANGNEIYSGGNFLELLFYLIIVSLLYGLFFLMPLVIYFKVVYGTKLNATYEKSMYLDYKEIIDEMIEKSKK